MGIAMDSARVRNLHAKAHTSDESVKQVRTWETEWKVELFFPPVASELVPSAMSAEVRFGTMTELLMTVIEFGMKHAPPLCR